MASSSQIRRRQLLVFLIGTGGIFFAFKAFIWWVSEPEDKPAFQQQVSRFNTSIKPVKSLETWQDKMQSDNEELRASLKSAEALLQQQSKLFDEQQATINELQSTVKAVKTAQTVQQYHADKQEASNAEALFEREGGEPIQTSTGQAASQASSQQAGGGVFTHHKAAPYPQTATYAGTQPRPQASEPEAGHAPLARPELKVQHIKLERKGNVKFDVNNYITAGSFVPAIVLGGIMAGAGVESQAEPRPMLLEVLDYAKLPNKFRRNVKHCRIVASGYGDVSSKRAFVRAHTLSCTMQDETVFEEEIQAYIAGDDSMAGIQGKVIRNEKDILQNLFIAGFLGTSGNTIQQTLGKTSVSPLGSIHTKNKKDILPGMFADGLTSSANELQRLFAEMAKQHHPVIQVTPGQEVTVVFLKGVNFRGAVS